MESGVNTRLARQTTAHTDRPEPLPFASKVVITLSVMRWKEQYNRINGVMKGSSRENGEWHYYTLSYRLNKLNFSNNLRVGNSGSNESPLGLFQLLRQTQLMPGALTMPTAT